MSRLIDADALKKNMEFTCMGVMAGIESYNAPLKDVDNAPTIEPEPHWIPCSERLPEKNDEVLVTGKVDNALYVDIDEWTGSGFWINAFSVIAWMPLPEPYKGEQE